MNSPWLIQALILLVTSRCDCRPSPRGCGRKFHFDFERGHPSEYEGGIWQGLDGRVTFRGGKAWLDGHGSLIYPFFSHNDLRLGFAFSFRIKPAKIAPGGRVAIITNGVEAGSSTLTVFHNGTCLGVKVVEIAETLNPAEGSDFSRNVELSVDYTKQLQRLKRSSDTSTTADVYIDPVQLDDDVNNGEGRNDTTGPLEISEKGPGFSSGELSGNHGDVAGVPDDWAQEDNGASTMNYDIIAVRKLYKEYITNTHSPAYQVDVVTENPENDVKDTLSTTTTTTTTSYSDIANTSSSTTYKNTTELPSTSWYTVITETVSTPSHNDITNVQSTTMYTPSTTTHIDTTTTASTTTNTTSTTTYSHTAVIRSTTTDIDTTTTNTTSTTTYSHTAGIRSTTTDIDTTTTASTTTYSHTAGIRSTTTDIDTTERASTTTDTPSTTTYSEDKETVEQTYTDNRSTNSDSESDANPSIPQGGFKSSSVSGHTATTLTDSASHVTACEQTTPTPIFTTDFVVNRQPSVHIASLTEQTTAVDHVSTHVSSDVSLQQTTVPPATTSRGPEERVAASRRNRFLIIPNIFRGLQEEDPDEIEVRLAQDSGVLRLQVGESDIQETSVGVTEHMKAPRSALRVGAGDGLLPYRGSFDEFSMYDCAPLRFFSDENRR